MKKSKAKLLLVEDDENLGFVVKDFLEIKGYTVQLCSDGEQGLEYFNNNFYDLIILDVMLPLKDGFTLAEEIRKKDKLIPVIFLTAKGLEEDRVKGFKIGADDYITKPFSTEELNLRIEAILRRSVFTKNNADKSAIFKLGKYTFNYYERLLEFDKKQENLTKKEAELLHLLCLSKGDILKRDVALKHIWGQDDYFMGRSMDVYIVKLRKYFKNDPIISITNIHGTGFRLEIKE